MTGETVGKIKGELDGGDVKGLAEAIAKSRGGRTRAVAESVATVSLQLSLNQFMC